MSHSLHPLSSPSLFLLSFLSFTHILFVHTEEPKALHTHLKDGIVLCRLMMLLDARLIPLVYSSSPSPFQQRENIDVFLSACEEYGLARSQLFRTNDLYFNNSMLAVVNTLCALGELADKVEGEKRAEMAKRKFGVRIGAAGEKKEVPSFVLDETAPLRKVARRRLCVFFFEFF